MATPTRSVITVVGWSTSDEDNPVQDFWARTDANGHVSLLVEDLDKVRVRAVAPKDKRLPWMAHRA